MMLLDGQEKIQLVQKRVGVCGKPKKTGSSDSGDVMSPHEIDINMSITSFCMPALALGNGEEIIVGDLLCLRLASGTFHRLLLGTT